MKTRIIFWLILAGAVGWLFFMGIVPSGKIAYVNDFEKENEFVQKLTPAERVEPAKDGTQEIIGNPVYFSVRAPRKFEKARLILKYRRGQEAKLPIGSLASFSPIIEAGVLVDKQIWRYDLKPVENRIIDDLSLVWDVIREGRVILLQRGKKFFSLDDFLNNLPAREEIALYNYNLELSSGYSDNPELSSGYPELSSKMLRGDYQFYSYIKDENLNFNFSFQDLNQNKDSDPVGVNVYYRGQLIDSRHLADDGISTDSGQISQERLLDLNLANLPAGVYKIEVRAGDDIVTKKLETSLGKLAFINKIWIYNQGLKNFSVFTDSLKVDAQTAEPASLQTLRVGDKDLEISETYKMFGQKTGAGPTEIKVQKGGIILSGDGVFAFSKDSLINPNFRKVTSDLDIDQAGINYILADYQSPAKDGDWKVASVEFDISNAYREFSKNSFIISIPSLSAEDGIDDYIEIDEIKVELQGKTLWQKIKEIFKK